MNIFAEYVFKKTEAAYRRKLLLTDADGLDEHTRYSALFEKRGFRVIRYSDSLHFRTEHDDAMRDGDARYLLIAKAGAYIPYDVQKKFWRHTVSLSALFPKLDTGTLKDARDLNYDLLTIHSCSFRI